QICADYRNAIVHWMRLHRLDPHEAEDAAHDFLERWLRRDNPLKGFERGERRFRDFLHVCLRRFLVDRIATKEAKRRGGGMSHLQVEAHEPAALDTDSVATLDYALA